MNKSRQFNDFQNEMRNLDDITPEINERAPKEVESTHSPEKVASIPFCQAFKRDTKLARLSQRDIAERLNVSQQSVSKWLIKNYLPKRHREPLARFLKGSLGEGLHRITLCIGRLIDTKKRTIRKTYEMSYPRSKNLLSLLPPYPHQSPCR